ncbi:PucR family transcriptional regulator [Naumannella huperziae]
MGADQAAVEPDAAAPLFSAETLAAAARALHIRTLSGVCRGCSGLHIVDRHDDTTIPPGALVLAVGVGPDSPEAAALVARSSGVIFRRSGYVEPFDAEAWVGLVPAGTDWGRLYAGLTERLWTSRAGDQRARLPEGNIGSLYALADALAGALDGAVTIVDWEGRLAAYSNHELEDLDEIRSASLRGRTSAELPPDVAGVWPPARTIAADTFYYPAVPHRDLHARLQARIRLGDQVVGFISVIRRDNRESAADLEIAQEAARIAGILFSEASEISASASDVAALLFDGEIAPSVLDRVPASAARPLSVIAFGRPDQQDWESRADRAARLLRVHLAAKSVPSVVHSTDQVLYACLSVPAGDDQDRVLELARSTGTFLREILAADLRAGIGTPVATWAQVPRARWEAEQAMRVTPAATGNRLSLTPFATVVHEVVLNQLRDLALGRDALLAGPVRQLRAHDEENDTDYVATLRTYLDVQPMGIPTAAGQLFVHPNTVRYRLRRIQEITGLDLDDPVQRLIAHLQTYLIAGPRPAPPRPGDPADAASNARNDRPPE